MNDLPMVLNWRNHPAVRNFMFTQNEISTQEHHNWFDRIKHDQTRKQLLVLDESGPFGFVQFKPVYQGGISEWGFYVRPDAPKGSGSKLGQVALTYAFKNLRLHKVCGQVIESNVPSIKLHEKLGFTQESLRRECQEIGRSYHTLYRFGLLSKNWQERQ